MLSRTRTLLIAALSLVMTSSVSADDRTWHEQHSAYEQAREAVRLGRALPLNEVRQHLQRVAPGRIVATHYEFEFERWVYEFKILDPQGRLRKVHLDARSGELVKMSDY